MSGHGGAPAENPLDEFRPPDALPSAPDRAEFDAAVITCITRFQAGKATLHGETQDQLLRRIVNEEQRKLNHAHSHGHGGHAAAGHAPAPAPAPVPAPGTPPAPGHAPAGHPGAPTGHPGAAAPAPHDNPLSNRLEAEVRHRLRLP